MAKNLYSKVIFTAIYISSMIYVGSGRDFGFCPPEKETCECGSPNGYSFHVTVRRCSGFYKFEHSCYPCDKLEKDDRCAPYKHCETCADGSNNCITCPRGRYGDQCHIECKCENYASCDRKTGKCICLDGFDGDKCEKTKGCPHINTDKGQQVSPMQIQYVNGNIVSFSCDNGYVLEGPSSIECLSNGQWSNTVPNCKRECAPVSAPLRGFASAQSGRLTENSIVTYSCESGYQLYGNSVTTCQKDGTWTSPTPICHKITVCDDPEDSSFMTHSLHRQGNINQIIPGSTVTFECDPDHILIGQEKLTCNERGKWSADQPVCVTKDQTCLHPGPIGNGTTTPERLGNGAFVVGTVVTYTCNTFFYMVGKPNAVCQSGGNWSNAKPVCLKLITCSGLNELVNGNVTIFSPKAQPMRSLVGNRRFGSIGRAGTGVRFRSSHPEESEEARQAKLAVRLPAGHYHVGSKAEFTCESRYYRLYGKPTRICTSKGVWNGQQSICIPECGRASAPKRPSIVNGEVSRIGQWPWQVAIAYKQNNTWDTVCGGVLISEQWVLTAAHCVTYTGLKDKLPADQLRLYLGKYYRDNKKSDSDVVPRRVIEIVINTHYEPPPSLQSDIALLHLLKPVKFTNRIQVACLPESEDMSNERLSEGNTGMVIGWGTTETGNLSDILRHTELPVVPNSKCKKAYSDLNVGIDISREMFCAGQKTGRSDSCQGDSGGPMVFPLNENRDRWVLEGIVSWGTPYKCGTKDQYSGFVRVQRFKEWIDSIV